MVAPGWTSGERILVLHNVAIEIEVEGRADDEAIDILAHGDGLDLLEQDHVG